MCTLQGYVKRQAVFACSTCTGEGMEPAGVCLACANTCHDGHHIYELYTKRYSPFTVYNIFKVTSNLVPHTLTCIPVFNPICFSFHRNFCCDCGNSKFGSFKCKLIPVSVFWMYSFAVCAEFIICKVTAQCPSLSH